MLDDTIYDTTLTSQLFSNEITLCNELGLSYQTALANAMPIVFSVIDGNPLSYSFWIFSSSFQIEQVFSVEEALWQVGIQSFLSCPKDYSGDYVLGTYQIAFLVLNVAQLEQASTELNNRMLNQGLGRDTQLMDGVFVATFVSISVGILSIVVILIFLRRHRQFKERVLLLVTRVSRQEAEKEIAKFKKCSLLLLDPSESWANFDFVSYLTTDYVIEEKNNNAKINEVSMRRSRHINLQAQDNQNEDIKEPHPFENHENFHPRSKISMSQLLNEPQGATQTEIQTQKIVPNKQFLNKEGQDIVRFRLNKKMAVTLDNILPQQQQSQSGLQKKQQSRLVSSQLTTRNLSPFKEVSIFIGLILMGFAFMLIATIIALVESAKLDTAVTFYSELISTFSSIRAFLVLSILVLINDHFQFGISYITSIVQARDNIQSFSNKFIDWLQMQTMLPEASKSLLSQLFENDICDTLTNNSSSIPAYLLYQFNKLCVNQDSLDESNIQYQLQLVAKGISGLTNQILSLCSDILEFSNITDPVLKESQMRSILNSEFSKSLLIHGFELPLNTVAYMLELLQQGYMDRSQTLLDLFVNYFAIVGSLLLVCSLTVCLLYLKTMKTNLKDMTFSLTLLPYERLIDDNSISILRNLKQSQ